MVDVILANKLVKAVAPGAHLLLVGDVDQLPSVGAGEVLRDMITAAGAPGRPADEDLPAGAAVRDRRQRAQGQRRPPARAERVPGLLLVQLRRDRGHRRAGGRHRGAADPGRVRPRPAARRAGAVPDAPRPGRGRKPEPAAAGGAHPVPGGRARAALRRAGVPGRRQGDPAAQQLRQGRGGHLQRHHRRRDQHVAGRPQPHRPHRRGRGDPLRLRRARRARARLRRHHPPLPGVGVPGRRHPADDQRVDDAPAQPALHRHHPREETRRPGRLTPRPGRRRPHQRHRTPPHRPRPPPPAAGITPDASSLPAKANSRYVPGKKSRLPDASLT